MHPPMRPWPSGPRVRERFNRPIFILCDYGLSVKHIKIHITVTGFAGFDSNDDFRPVLIRQPPKGLLVGQEFFDKCLNLCFIHGIVFTIEQDQHRMLFTVRAGIGVGVSCYRLNNQAFTFLKVRVGVVHRFEKLNRGKFCHCGSVLSAGSDRLQNIYINYIIMV